MELDTKQSLIRAAIELFGEKGLGGTSVKDICEKAGVNVSLVSYYFDGKDGLYKSCLEQIGTQGLAAAERLLTEVQSLEEFKLRLGLFVEELVRAQSEQPQLTKFIHRECMGAAHSPLLREVFERTFHRVFTSLQSYITKAQEAGFVRKDLEPFVVTGFVFGSTMHLCQSDEIRKQFYNVTISDPVFRKKAIDQLVSVFVNGIAAN